MISFRYAKSYCCEDISLIENYNLAISDETQTWDIHHRLETDLGLTPKELKEQGKYFKVPASELIFLPHSEHLRLHCKGKPKSEESNRKRSENVKGEKNGMYGKDAWNKGQHGNCSEETLRKMSESMIGKNKGKHRVYRDDGTFYMSF